MSATARVGWRLINHFGATSFESLTACVRRE